MAHVPLLSIIEPAFQAVQKKGVRKIVSRSLEENWI